MNHLAGNQQGSVVEISTAQPLHLEAALSQRRDRTPASVSLRSGRRRTPDMRCNDREGNQHAQQPAQRRTSEATSPHGSRRRVSRHLRPAVE